MHVSELLQLDQRKTLGVADGRQPQQRPGAASCKTLVLKSHEVTGLKFEGQILIYWVRRGIWGSVGVCVLCKD